MTGTANPLEAMHRSEIVPVKKEYLVPSMHHSHEHTMPWLPTLPPSESRWEGPCRSSPLHGSHMPCFNLALNVKGRGFLAAKQEACLGHLQQDEPDEFTQVQAADHLFKPTIW